MICLYIFGINIIFNVNETRGEVLNIPVTTLGLVNF